MMFEVVSNTLEVRMLALVLTLSLVTSRKIVSKKKCF